VTDNPSVPRFEGGCLCGQLRYVADGAPSATGHCYCTDCQKVCGSGFIPFMNVPAGAIRIEGRTRQLVSPAANGRTATRNFCAECGSLVFGGVLNQSTSFTIYAGSLDDRSLFQPQIAIFDSNRPPWAPLAPSITRVFARLPEDEPNAN